jgi:hypothetical protein
MVGLQKEFNFIGFSICRIKTLYSIGDYFTFANIFKNKIFIKMGITVMCTTHAESCTARRFVRRSFNDRLY